MTEVEIETFEPEKIKFEGDDLKKKYFEANQDIKKIKSKYSEETNILKTELQTLQERMKDIENEKQSQIEKELEEQGKVKELAEQYKSKHKEAEKQLKEYEKILSEYKAKEEAERKAKEEKRLALLEKLNEEDKDAFKDAPLSAIEKYLGKEAGGTSFIKEPQINKGVPTDIRMKTEMLHDSPARNFAQDLINKGIIKY